MPKPDILDQVELEKQTGPLTEEQEEAIHQKHIDQINKAADEEDPFAEEEDATAKAKREQEEAEAEAEAEEKKLEDERAQETEAEKKTREEKEAQEAEETENAEKEKEAEEKKQAIEAARAKKPEELDDDEKALIKESDDANEAKQKKDVDEYVLEYAEKMGLTETQARKDVEKIYGLSGKYKGDSRELSKALYHLNAKLTQAQQRLSQIEQMPGDGELTVKGKKLNKEDAKEFLVGAYKEHHKDLTEGLEDNKIHQLAIKELKETWRIQREKSQVEVKDLAETKRRELLENVPEEDKRFIKDIRGAIYRSDDRDVLGEDFDISDYVYWARGKNYHRDVKTAVDKAVAEALKGKKIVGKKAENAGGGGGGGKKTGAATSLTEDDKTRALEMYDVDLPDEKKFEMYLDFKNSVKPKKKK